MNACIYMHTPTYHACLHLCRLTKQWVCADPAHIQSVKAALHLSAVPDAMICRDIEQEKVFEYCKDRLFQRCSGSLYVCGCPGTGKSLLMEKVKSLASKWADEVFLLPNWMIVF